MGMRPLGSRGEGGLAGFQRALGGKVLRGNGALWVRAVGVVLYLWTRYGRLVQPCQTINSSPDRSSRLKGKMGGKIMRS